MSPSATADPQALPRLRTDRLPLLLLPVLALVALAMLLQGVVTYRLGRQAGRRGE